MATRISSRHGTATHTRAALAPLAWPQTSSTAPTYSGHPLASCVCARAPRKLFVTSSRAGTQAARWADCLAAKLIGSAPLLLEAFLKARGGRNQRARARAAQKCRPARTRINNHLALSLKSRVLAGNAIKCAARRAQANGARAPPGGRARRRDRFPSRIISVATRQQIHTRASELVSDGPWRRGERGRGGSGSSRIERPDLHGRTQAASA